MPRRSKMTTNLEPLSREPNDASLETEVRSLWQGRICKGVCVAAILMCVLGSLIYLTRPDSFAAITVFPPWVWSIPGLGIAWFARKQARRYAFCTGLVWILFLFTFIDQPTAMVGLLHRRFPDPIWQQTPTNQRIRVITLNCGSGGIASAREAISFKPNLLLLQEPPNSIAIKKLAQELFGDNSNYLAGIDTSIIADGKVIRKAKTRHRDLYSVHARVELTNGIAMEVISLRLEPPIVRIDLWSPDCWIAQTDNRRVRNKQIDAIAERISSTDVATPLIVGGDFNAPPGDAIFDNLEPRLSDAFEVAGLGLGHTITNIAPFARIDQVWISEHWAAHTVVSRKTIHSDHRMVVVDLTVRREE